MPKVATSKELDWVYDINAVKVPDHISTVCDTKPDTNDIATFEVTIDIRTVDFAKSSSNDINTFQLPRLLRRPRHPCRPAKYPRRPSQRELQRRLNHRITKSNPNDVAAFDVPTNSGPSASPSPVPTTTMPSGSPSTSQPSVSPSQVLQPRSLRCHRLQLKLPTGI